MPWIRWYTPYREDASTQTPPPAASRFKSSAPRTALTVTSTQRAAAMWYSRNRKEAEGS